MQWGPVNSSDFLDFPSQNAFVQGKKQLEEACQLLLVKASQHLFKELVQGCANSKCSDATCRLYRGCLLFTARSLAPKEPGDVSVEWRSLAEIVPLQTHRLLFAACTYDRLKAVLTCIHIPGELLQPLLKPGAAPAGGVLGMGTSTWRALDSSFVKWAFKEALGVTPEGQAIDEAAVPVLPTSPESVPRLVEVAGLGPHCTIPLLGPKPAAAAAAVGPVPAATTGSGAGQQGGGGAAAGAGQGAGQAGGSPLLWLQRTINTFWCTVGGMRPRLTARVRKIKCREFLTCDGVSCYHCRGAMVFEVAALEAPDRAWQYKYDGQVVDSTAPKQYIRGRWMSALELQRELGCADAPLLAAITTHDRRAGYVVALHLPTPLVTDLMDGVPPGGALLWQLVPHADPLQPAGAPAPQGAAGAPGSPLHIPTAMSHSAKPQQGQQGPGSDSEGDVSGGAHREGGGQQGQGQPAGPRCCAFPGCAVSESPPSAGVVLLMCSGCRQAAYCTPAHQRAHWHEHRRVCVAGKKAG